MMFINDYRTSITALGLVLCMAATSVSAQNEQRQRNMGDPFRTVFGLTGQLPEWWIAEYDHQEAWMQTAWRKLNVAFSPVGVEIALHASDEQIIVSPEDFREDPSTSIESGFTSKAFLSGQIQRRGWYGYGRYEIIMQPAKGAGLISAFYIYTGPHFGDTHEELDIEVLGQDTGKVHLNRYRDGRPLTNPVTVDVGLDTSEKPQLFAFEWHEGGIAWYMNDVLLFQINDPAEVPLPPGKIYFDLWAGSAKQANWAGEAAPDVTGYAIVQCVSFAAQNSINPQCSNLKRGD
jgi:hypothetical protein